MTRDELVDYHNIASLTKFRGTGIGFAGVGAKIFLDRCEYILTETKSKSFYGATKWIFSNSTPTWMPIPTQNKIKNAGTFVEVKLKIDEDRKKLNISYVTKVLQEHYNAILLGYYPVREVRINGRKVYPREAHDVEVRKDLDFTYSRHRIRGFLAKSKSEVPDKFQGPRIVVCGKTIQQHWFRQHPLEIESFYGLILADHLVDILTTSKTQFDYTSVVWKKFQAKVGGLLSDWLYEIGAKPRPTPTPSDMERLSEELEKSINKLLKMPEFTDLANTIFQNRIQRTISIPSDIGEHIGSEVEGKQIASGTLGGPGEGIGTVGDEEGKGAVLDETGATPVERVRRRVRGGIKIGYENQPNNVSEGWIDPSRQNCTVNSGHPAYRVAEGLSLQIRAQHVLVYHILRTVFNIIIEESGIEHQKETLAKLFSTWHQLYVRSAI